MDDIQSLASGVIRRVLAGRSLDPELATLWRSNPGLSPQQRAMTQDVCFGTLRFLGLIDALLQALLDKPLRDEKLRCLLRIALYQLEYTGAAPHAVVDHAVRACERLGLTSAKGLANAVLRNFLRRRAALVDEARRSDAGRYSYPQWWVAKLRDQYPEQHEAILDAGNLHPPMTLRVNRRRTSAEDYLALLENQGIAAKPVGGAAIRLEDPQPVERIPGFAEGWVSVQDAAAQLAAPFLAAEAGMRVLDACSAPGGKAAHILERARVDLVALDADAARLERVTGNFDRLGLNAQVVCGDACDPAAWWDGRPFDRILADVPCSASGVVRRHPDIKWLRREADIARFAERQRAMLEALWRPLASDGKLLYATCSVFHEENQLQIAQFLEHHRDARRLTLPAPELQLQQVAGQLLPDEWHDGFFYALLQKE